MCAVKAHCRNVERPRGIQVPREPLELSIAGHFAMWGIRVRRDNWASVRYAEGLNSSKSSVTLQSTDRHGIVVRQVVLKRK